MGEFLLGALHFILEVIVPLSVGAVMGYAICALMTMASHSDMEAELDSLRKECIKWQTVAEAKSEALHAAMERRR